MINLVLHGARQQLLAFVLDDVPLFVVSPDANFVCTLDLFPETGNAQATFFADLRAFFTDDLRIDENELPGLVLSLRSIDNCQTSAKTNLRGGEAESLGCVHRVPHVGDQSEQLRRIELRNWFGDLFEDGVAIFDNLPNHLVTLNLGKIA